MDYSLSPTAMFLNAGPVSKVVMAVLVLASIWTWILIVDGVYVALRISKAIKSARAGGAVDVLWPIACAGERAASASLPGETNEQRRNRILESTRRAAAEFMTSARGGLSNLAIVSSVGPFVGLFGTVWGIMSSFSSIAQTQDTSLTIVAPGIAEALAATAYGLAAAIPAAIGYNRIGAAFSEIGDEVSQFVADDVISLTKDVT
ncbi:MotA/TolQ/ExbB proton channel family protein [Methylocystis parvus]|uniref:MotA/TolQ/ExbB proton channel family protein n=1 Tax=Methylocystis parvus TaxID=134 RepID=UPI003C722031